MVKCVIAVSVIAVYVGILIYQAADHYYWRHDAEPNAEAYIIKERCRSGISGYRGIFFRAKYIAFFSDGFVYVLFGNEYSAKCARDAHATAVIERHAKKIKKVNF